MLYHDFLMTVSLLYHDFLMTFSWLTATVLTVFNRLNWPWFVLFWPLFWLDWLELGNLEIGNKPALQLEQPDEWKDKHRTENPVSNII